MKPLDEQLSLIKRGTLEIIREEELVEKIKRSITEKKPLIVKAGFDPTAPDIHLGHTVLLRKLRHFQECGHKVVFLIGDATALIGDPTGRSQTRKVLTEEEVMTNARTYEAQVGKILDVADKNIFVRRHNNEWFSKFTFGHFVDLAQRYTVARLLERDDFTKRMKENQPISYLELFYPLMQGYDSVKLESDIELGGNDQKFNMLVGRTLQESYGQKPQIVMTMPILEGLDGVNKMSKSLGNYVSVRESADEMFGKIMSVSDQIMMKYYELLTDEPMEALKKGLANGSIHPRDAKKKLARIIIAQYHTEQDAESAEQNFEKAFKDKGFPNGIAVTTIITNGPTMEFIAGLSDITQDSKGEIKRKIKEGAVEINGEKVKDFSGSFKLDTEYKIRIGKRFFRAIFDKN
ncbi:MAG: tyrosine--tRNA ligase [Candidatus Omnitrophica bacterium]|nr:tyrosine--tRNA ligase [Candidatus Omnitrophota bacterium]